MISIHSKLAQGGSSIFSVMSKLAKEHDAINLGQGFPNFDCHPKLKELVSNAMQEGKNQYAPMAGVLELREALAQKANSLYNSTINPDDNITITAGATQAIYTIINAFVSAGDEVVIIEPAYDSYAPSIKLVGGKVVSYCLEAPNFKVDWESFALLLTSKTKMVIINTPQNPIGKVFTKADMMALENLVTGKNIIVLSDEVYEHLIYDNHEHQSVLKFPNLFNQSIAVFSFGKTFHNTGWKMGYCIAPDYLMQEFRNVHQWNVFSVNSFIQYGLAEYLKDPNSYNSLGAFYQKKRDYFNNMMENSSLKPLVSEGTYFQLYDYSEISDELDTDFAIRLTKEFGVASIPVSPFYSKEMKDSKVIRFCFAKTEEVLNKAGVQLSQI